jgi:hypothetical protein
LRRTTTNIFNKCGHTTTIAVSVRRIYSSDPSWQTTPGGGSSIDQTASGKDISVFFARRHHQTHL